MAVTCSINSMAAFVVGAVRVGAQSYHDCFLTACFSMVRLGWFARAMA